MSLTKQQLLAAADRAPQPVALPGGTTAYLVPLSCDAVDHVELCLENAALRSGLIAYIITRGVVDVSGQRVFSDEDAPAIGAKPSPIFSFLAKEILAISRLEKADVERLEKNCGATPPASAG